MREKCMVKPGYLVVQYSIIKQEGSKTVQRTGIHVCTQAPGQTMPVVFQTKVHWTVRFVTGSCCHGIFRGTLILCRLFSFRVFTYRLSCCNSKRLVSYSQCKLQDSQKKFIRLIQLDAANSHSVISNPTPVISNSHYFELFFVSPESSK